MKGLTAVSLGPGIGIVELRLAHFSCLGRRSDRGTVKLGRDFHTHDFEQHANASTVVQMRETTKGLRERTRQDAHLLADLQTVIKTNGPTAFT